MAVESREAGCRPASARAPSLLRRFLRYLANDPAQCPIGEIRSEISPVIYERLRAEHEAKTGQPCSRVPDEVLKDWYILTERAARWW